MRDGGAGTAAVGDPLEAGEGRLPRRFRRGSPEHQAVRRAMVGTTPIRDSTRTSGPSCEASRSIRPTAASRRSSEGTCPATSTVTGRPVHSGTCAVGVIGRLNSLGSRSTASEMRACTTTASLSRLRLRSSSLMSTPITTTTATSEATTTAVVTPPDCDPPPDALLDAGGPTTVWAQAALAGHAASAEVTRATRAVLIVFIISPPGRGAAKSVPRTYARLAEDLRDGVSLSGDEGNERRQLLHASRRKFYTRPACTALAFARSMQE